MKRLLLCLCVFLFTLSGFSQTTPYLHLNEPTTDEYGWGVLTNANWVVLDTFLGGLTGCTTGQIPVESSSGWVCGADVSGLADPGSPGVVKRTTANITAIANSADIIGLFSGCSGTLSLGADGNCHPNTAGLSDPGANGVVKRTAFNVTAAAASADIIALFSGCSGTLYLGADGVCHSGAGGGLPTGLTFSVSTFTVSSAGNGNGVVALSGNTSGTATMTAPAVAATRTNPILVSNSMQIPSGTTFEWNGDTGLSRDPTAGADNVDCGNGTPGDTSCTFSIANLKASGTITGGSGSGGQLIIGQIKGVGSAPTCAFTAGGGTGGAAPSCTMGAGSTNLAGVMILTTGAGTTTAPGFSGLITLTFNSPPFGTNSPACLMRASNHGVTNLWNGVVMFTDQLSTTTSDETTYYNGVGSSPLSASTVYDVIYHCFAE